MFGEFAEFTLYSTKPVPVHLLIIVLVFKTTRKVGR